MGRRIGGAGGGSDPGNGPGRMVAAAAAALAVAGGTGAVSLGGAAVEGEAAAEGLTNSVESPNLKLRKNEATKSARSGKTDEAWRRMGLRTVKKIAKQDLTCLAASKGRVREFFLHTPCTSLDRLLFAVGDGHGSVAAVSVAWVGFRSRDDVDAFERIETVQGSGDIKPMAGALLELAHVRFTGHHYTGRPAGKTMVIAEAETASGHIGDDVLDAITEVAVWLPRPQ